MSRPDTKTMKFRSNRRLISEILIVSENNILEELMTRKLRAFHARGKKAGWVVEVQ